MKLFGLKITTAKKHEALVHGNQMLTNAVAEATRRALVAEKAGLDLWNGHADILEMATAKPNATARRMLARAEEALQNDVFTHMKPERKWSKK